MLEDEDWEEIEMDNFSDDSEVEESKFMEIEFE